MTTPLTYLSDQTTGCFLMRTETGSEYVIDLDNHTMLRKPDLTDEVAVSMRRDADTVQLVEIRSAVVGCSGYFVIDLNVEGVEATLRITSPITSIEEITEDSNSLDATPTGLLDRETLAAEFLGIPLVDAQANQRSLPAERATYFWEPGRGGGALIVGEDGGMLFANSSVPFDTHVEAFAGGRRILDDALSDLLARYPNTLRKLGE